MKETKEKKHLQKQEEMKKSKEKKAKEKEQHKAWNKRYRSKSSG